MSGPKHGEAKRIPEKATILEPRSLMDHKSVIEPLLDNPRRQCGSLRRVMEWDVRSVGHDAGNHQAREESGRSERRRQWRWDRNRGPEEETHRKMIMTANESVTHSGRMKMK